MSYSGSHAYYQANKERLQKRMRDHRVTHPARYMFYAVRNRCRKSGMEFTIDEALLAKLLEPNVCSVTGIPPEPLGSGKRHSRSPWAPSVDRIDSSRGYVPDNVRVVCWMYNAAKQDWSDAEVMRMVEALWQTSRK